LARKQFYELDPVTALGDGDTFALQQYSGSEWVTRRASGAQLGARYGAQLPYYTSGGIGLTIDGVTDITSALNTAIETISNTGGGHIVFGNGVVFGSTTTSSLVPYINGTVVNRSNVRLDFTYVPSVRLGPYGNIRNQGTYASFSAVIYLSQNATAGGTTFRAVPVTGSITDYMQVGSKLVLRGNRDSGGGALHFQEVTVTALDAPTGSVTVSEALLYSFAVEYSGSAWAAAGNQDKTTVTVRVSSLLTADAAIGDKTFALTSAAGFSVGSMLELRDEKQCDDIAGTSTALINTEHFIVTGISGNNVTVDRRAQRLFDNAHNARAWLVEPCVNASIIGANIQFTEAPPPSPRIDTLVNWNAYRSTIERCRILNQNDNATTGSRGQMFCNRYSFRCGIYDCVGERPKYTAGGEGYCLTNFHSTECEASGISASGLRHASYMEVATGCTAHFSSIKDCTSVAVDFHGCLEIDCHVNVDRAEGGATTDFVAFGHSDNYAGTRDCSATCNEGEYFDIVSVYEPGSENCTISGNFANVRIGAQIFNRTAADPVTVTRPMLRELYLDTVSEYIINADGQEDGAGATVSRPIVDLRLDDVYARNVIKGFRIRYVDGCVITDCEVDKHAVDAGDTYLFRVLSVLELTITQNRFTEQGRFLSISASPAFAVTFNIWNRLANASYTNVLDETGASSAGFYFYGNDAIGFTPDASSTSTPTTLSLALLGA
jgi:hypothetical protein